MVLLLVVMSIAAQWWVLLQIWGFRPLRSLAILQKKRQQLQAKNHSAKALRTTYGWHQLLRWLVWALGCVVDRGSPGICRLTHELMPTILNLCRKHTHVYFVRIQSFRFGSTRVECQVQEKVLTHSALWEVHKFLSLKWRERSSQTVLCVSCCFSCNMITNACMFDCMFNMLPNSETRCHSCGSDFPEPTAGTDTAFSPTGGEWQWW